MWRDLKASSPLPCLRSVRILSADLNISLQAGESFYADAELIGKIPKNWVLCEHCWLCGPLELEVKNVHKKLSFL